MAIDAYELTFLDLKPNKLSILISLAQKFDNCLIFG